MSQADTPSSKMQDFERVLDKSAKTVAQFDEPAATPMRRIQNILHANPTIVPFIVLALGVIVFGLVSNNFMTAFNLTTIIKQVTIVGIIGIAQTLVILTAGIDLSVAAIMVLSTVIMGSLSVELGVPTPIGVLLES